MKKKIGYAFGALIALAALFYFILAWLISLIMKAVSNRVDIRKRSKDKKTGGDF